MFKVFRYSSDMLQTRMPFWYSFRSNLSDTVQIRSRQRMPFWYSFRFNFSDTVQIRSRQRMPFWYSFRFNFSDTVQIRSKNRCHSDTHSDTTFKYSSYMLQTRMPSWHSFRFNSQIQYRYAQNTDAIMILILSSYKLHFNKHCWMESISPSPTRLCHLSKWHL